MVKKRAEPETIEEKVEPLLKEITPAQRQALLLRQLGLFDFGTVVSKGPTVSALRRRGLVEAHKRVTALGAMLCDRLSAA